MMHDAWIHTMQSMGIGENENVYNLLTAAYSEKHRAYHTLEHIKACLQHLSDVENEVENLGEMRVALWFHDAIYQPFSGTNEEDSANWATSFLKENNIPASVSDRVHALIMATKNHEPDKPGDQQLILDIDLSILGASASAYAQFENDIRTEYKTVPNFIFKRKRRAILEGFLARPRLFTHPHFFDALENNARLNLADAIEKLR